MKIAIDGANGEAIGFEGEVLRCSLDRAYAPGAPIRLRVLFDDGELPLECKTVGSKRDGDRFEVRMRIVNMRRIDRPRLESINSEAKPRD
jgi:hypothetical protein